MHGTTILGISEQSYDHHTRILEIASHFGIVFDPGRQTTAAPKLHKSRSYRPPVDPRGNLGRGAYLFRIGLGTRPANL